MGESSPSPVSRPRWVDRRRQRLRSPLLRKLERSFGLRLLVALTAALAALVVVNRWDQCRHQAMKPSCVWRDAGGVVNVGNLEALSIMTAGFLFILEGGQRRQRQHIEAMELILNCQQVKARFSYARNEALEILSEAGISLDGFDLSGTNLDDLQVPGGHWEGVNLAGSSLRGADLRGIDLEAANLEDTDLLDAKLQGANLSGANLNRANLRGAVLSDAVLDGAQLDGAQLEGATLPESFSSGGSATAG